MKCLYKYPQAEFPYERLVDGERAARRATSPSSSWSTPASSTTTATSMSFVEYAKAAPDDMLIRITVDQSRPGRRATLHLLPTLWFRNTLVLGPGARRPLADAATAGAARPLVVRRRATHTAVWLRWTATARRAELLFTDNETNTARLFGTPNATPYVKDAFHDYVVARRRGRRQSATGAAPRPPRTIALHVPGGGSSGRSALRLTDERAAAAVRPTFDEIFDATASPRPTSSTRRDHSDGIASATTSAASCGRRSPGCSGPSSSITTSSRTGSTAIPASRRRRRSARAGATTTGGTSTTPTSSRCPTSGSIRGTRRGTSRFTASRWRGSTPSSPRSSSCCCCASGTCTPTASCPPTSGRSAT